MPHAVIARYLIQDHRFIDSFLILLGAALASADTYGRREASMVAIGDRIRVESTKAPPREGVVTAVAGAMLRIHWASDRESTLVPAPGSLTVLGRAKRSGARSKQASKPAAAQPNTARPKKARSARTAAKPSSVRAEASVKPTIAKAGAKKAATSKKGKKRASVRKKR